METESVAFTVMIALAIAVVLVAPLAVAQDKPADNMEIVVEKIRADKKFFVAENMQLTEAEAMKMFDPDKTWKKAE